MNRHSLSTLKLLRTAFCTIGLPMMLLGPNHSIGRAEAARDTVKNVDAAGAAALLKDNAASGVVVLDVRTPDEYRSGHIADATNIDFRGSDFGDRVKKLDPSKTYLVHCASGGRSTTSLAVFQKLGFKSVVHLDGGFNAWKKAGYPVEKAK
jgi:rhodanese-related sulfurtransferase